MFEIKETQDSYFEGLCSYFYNDHIINSGYMVDIKFSIFIRHYVFIGGMKI